jgi:hypothetical protein
MGHIWPDIEWSSQLSRRSRILRPRHHFSPPHPALLPDPYVNMICALPA